MRCFDRPFSVFDFLPCLKSNQSSGFSPARILPVDVAVIWRVACWLVGLQEEKSPSSGAAGTQRLKQAVAQGVAGAQSAGRRGLASLQTGAHNAAKSFQSGAQNVSQSMHSVSQGFQNVLGKISVRQLPLGGIINKRDKKDARADHVYRPCDVTSSTPLTKSNSANDVDQLWPLDFSHLGNQIWTKVSSFHSGVR